MFTASSEGHTMLFWEPSCRQGNYAFWDCVDFFILAVRKS